jgi:F-box/leucine-rich repeat protein 2/20
MKRYKFIENYIIEFKEINDTHLFLIGENANYININGCHRVSDKGIIHIANKCKKLEGFEIYWMPHITDTSVRLIFENCINLRTLNLSGCKALTAKSLSLISNLHNLEELDLTRCVGLSDDILADIIKNPKLVKLSLYALPFLECRFFNSMTCKLEYLDICGNTTIVDEVFINNADKFTNLKYLNMV